MLRRSLSQGADMYCTECKEHLEADDVFNGFEQCEECRELLYEALEAQYADLLIYEVPFYEEASW